MILHRKCQFHRTGWFALTLTLAWAWLGAIPAQTAPDPATPDYQRDIRPILEKRCYSCHSRLKQKGDLRLDAGALILKGGKNGPAIVPGNPATSLLLQRITSQNDDDRMPPEGKPLSPEQIQLLQRWVESGASFPAHEPIPVAPSDHWAFQKVARPPLPALPNDTWSRNPIDRWVLRSENAPSLPPNSAPAPNFNPTAPGPEATPNALLRRIHLTLLGAPPDLADQLRFATDLEQLGPDLALDRVVDQLLAHPAYGERWSRHWLDLVRYADSNGYERDAAKPMVWRYRDYVIQAFNSDKPYNRFLKEQLAGDELPDATAESLVATGFLRLGHWDDEPADPDADRFDQLDDILSTTSQTMLGLTLGCARCHDHKFEPISTRDYYSMAAVFHPLRRPQNGRTELTRPVGDPNELSLLEKTDREIERTQNELLQTRQKLRASWIQLGGSRLPPTILSAFQSDPAKRTEEQKKQIAQHTDALDVEISSAQLEEPLRATRAHVQNLASRLQQLHRERPNLPQGYFLEETSPKTSPMHILLRGDPRRKGDVVEPAALSVLQRAGPLPQPRVQRTTGRRTALADWIAHPNNPLTARVWVNRVWLQHFGEGLVRTPSDFGLMGDRPTHPELLDWLADWFVHEGNWSVKHLHRLILTSRTWRLARRPRESSNPAVAESNSYWSGGLPHKRLEVEAIRDSILAASGQLNREMFGPAMFPAIPRQAIEANTDKDSIWKPSPESQRSRRTIYTFIKRGLVVPMLEVLDLCDTVHSTARRQTTTVAPQALTLFNGDFVNEQARFFARRLQHEAGADPRRQIDLAFRLTLARAPSPTETETLLTFLRSEPLEQLCRVLLNLNEFVYPD